MGAHLFAWQAQGRAEVHVAWQQFAVLALSDFVAGAALSQGQVQISWQRSTFARSSTDLVAGAAPVPKEVVSYDVGGTHLNMSMHVSTCQLSCCLSTVISTVLLQLLVTITTIVKTMVITSIDIMQCAMINCILA